jgi:hypothetical protein
VDSSIKFPVWFDPINHGGTPMCAAMVKTTEIIADWCDQHTNSYPPTIIYVTDGASTDGDAHKAFSDYSQVGFPTLSSFPLLMRNGNHFGAVTKGRDHEGVISY